MSDKITIHRTKHDASTQYFVMSRHTAQDRNLSFEARGLLSYLLSKPENWEVQIPDLMNEGNCGRDRVYRVIRELTERKYIKREAIRHDNKYAGIRYTVYELPYTDSQDTGFQDTEKPKLQSTDRNKRKKKTASAEADAGTPPLKVVKKPRPRNPLFDVVAKEVFGLEPNDLEENEGRIAKISNWLAGTYSGTKAVRVTKLSHPAEPRHVEMFAKWWSSKPGKPDMPRDLVKFAERWREWAIEANKRNAHQAPNPADDAKAAFASDFLASVNRAAAEAEQAKGA